MAMKRNVDHTPADEPLQKVSWVTTLAATPAASTCCSIYDVPTDEPAKETVVPQNIEKLQNLRGPEGKKQAVAESTKDVVRDSKKAETVAKERKEKISQKR